MSSETDILTLIPQRFPFVLIDRLEECHETGATSSFRIHAAQLLVRNGFLSEAGLIENMAQTAAARNGYICTRENKPVAVGYIAAVQNLLIHQLPQVGELLTTEILIRNQVLNVTIIYASIVVGARPVATCEMKIFIRQ